MVSVLCKSSFLQGQYADPTSVFLEIKTLVVKKTRAATQMDHSSENSFHGLPSKTKRLSIRKHITSSLSSQLLVSFFLRNSHLHKDIQQTFFDQYFCELLENSWSASKKCSKNVQKVHKKTTMVKSQFSKVAGFNRSSHQKCSAKKGSLRKVFPKFTEKHLFQRLYFNKVAGLRLCKREKRERPWYRRFPVKFAKFIRTSFSQNSSRQLLLLLAFLCNFTKMGYCQQCLENLQ